MGPSHARRTLTGGRELRLTDGHRRAEENAIPSRSSKSKGEDDEKIREILETHLKIQLPRDLHEALSDGVVLCHFINQLHPHSVPSIHVPSPSVVRPPSPLHRSP